MFEDLERHRADIERNRENAARLAQVFAKYESNGQGAIEFEDRIDFGLTFIREPTFSYGAQIDLDDLADQLNLDQDAMPPVPLVSAMVTEWDQDNRDLYTGAWVAARVYFPPGDKVPLFTPVHIEHHFSFTAVAMKDIPVDVSD